MEVSTTQLSVPPAAVFRVPGERGAMGHAQRMLLVTLAVVMVLAATAAPSLASHPAREGEVVPAKQTSDWISPSLVNHDGGTWVRWTRGEIRVEDKCPRGARRCKVELQYQVLDWRIWRTLLTDGFERNSSSGAVRACKTGSHQFRVRERLSYDVDVNATTVISRYGEFGNSLEGSAAFERGAHIKVGGSMSAENGWTSQVVREATVGERIVEPWNIVSRTKTVTTTCPK